MPTGSQPTGAQRIRTGTNLSRAVHVTLITAVAAGIAAAQAPVSYELDFANAVHHEAQVRATFRDLPAAPLDVVMSRSSPGRYSLHEFARNVYNVRAEDEMGKPLVVNRTASNEWRVSGHSGSVVFRYTLWGDLMDGTYNSIDLTHGHLNGPATFVWGRGLEARGARVRLTAPNEELWHVSTQLAELADGWWSAPSRDFLMDSPIEFSSHQVREWTVDDRRFRLAMHSRGASDKFLDEFTKLARRVTEEAEAVYGGFPEYENDAYTFLIDNSPYASPDAMEHRNSAVITQFGPPEHSRLAQLLEPVAHEFFHSWNVERIRPKSLEPFDLERANISEDLWFAEGITNYYGHLILARAGIIDTARYAEDLNVALNAVINSPALAAGSAQGGADGMSEMAPLFDRPSIYEPTNQNNTFVSYYYAGEALGAALDLMIRTRFPGKSLDDMMRVLWRRHPDVDRPYNPEDLELALAKATGDKAFAKDFFDRFVSGAEKPDFETLLAEAGLRLRPAESDRAWAGMTRFTIGDMGLSVTAPLVQGSPGYKVGLDRGDRIVKVDGVSIKQQGDWFRAVQSRKPGEHSQLRVQGPAGERIINLKWGASPILELVPFEKSKEPLTSEMRDLRERWLGSKLLRTLPGGE